MKTVRVSDLEGAALDWAVAKACGIGVWVKNGHVFQDILGTPDNPCSVWSPSKGWGQCGPLIEGRIVFLALNGRMNRRPDGWSCLPVGTRGVPAFGETPLIAACRAIVAAKLGDVVDVPEELL